MSKILPSLNTGTFKIGSKTVTGSLNGLTDVVSSGLATGQTLVFDGAHWINQTPGTTQQTYVTSITITPTANVTGAAAYNTSFTSHGGTVNIAASYSFYMVNSSQSTGTAPWYLQLDGANIGSIVYNVGVGGTQPTPVILGTATPAAGSHTLNIVLPAGIEIDSGKTCTYEIIEIVNQNTFTLGNNNQLAALTDVAATSPAKYNLLAFNGAKWASTAGSGWITLSSANAYLNGWADFQTGTWVAGQYRITGYGEVQMRGLIKPGTSGTINVGSTSGSASNSIILLPAAACPNIGPASTTGFVFPCINTDGVSEVRVYGNGYITLCAGPGSPQWLSLDSIRYDIAVTSY